ncbi:MAG TPA: hypothetical protein VK866_13445 [Acidimicrobiales bacterium]|nr:hypothetical protein [Acidimicrobiales bacterium]
MAQANIDQAPPDAPPPSDIATAELHGQHVAFIASRLRAGARTIAAPYEEYGRWDGVTPRNLLGSGLDAL